MKHIVPPFSPSLAPACGKTKRLLEELQQLICSGMSEGADEVLALISQIQRADFNMINYFPASGAAPEMLARDFLYFISDGKSTSGLHALPMANATSALTSALLAHDVSGKKVLLPTLNFPGVVNAVVLAGGVPTLVDVDAQHFCMNVHDAAKKSQSNIGAVIVTHLNEVLDISLLQKENIPLLQDASVAMGSLRTGKHPGADRQRAGDVTIYSFATSKVLTGFGGAMVIGTDAAFVARMQMMAYQGMDFLHPGEMASTGGNWRISDFNAAIALAQLKRREELFAQRKKLRALYNSELQPLIEKEIVQLQQLSEDAVITHYAVRLPGYRKHVQRAFDEYGVCFGSWPMLHQQHWFQKRYGHHSFPHADALADSFCFLPFYGAMGEGDVKRVVDCIKKLWGV